MSTADSCQDDQTETPYWLIFLGTFVSFVFFLSIALDGTSMLERFTNLIGINKCCSIFCHHIKQTLSCQCCQKSTKETDWTEVKYPKLINISIDKAYRKYFELFLLDDYYFKVSLHKYTENKISNHICYESTLNWRPFESNQKFQYKRKLMILYSETTENWIIAFVQVEPFLSFKNMLVLAKQHIIEEELNSYHPRYKLEHCKWQIFIHNFELFKQALSDELHQSEITKIRSENESRLKYSYQFKTNKYGTLQYKSMESINIPPYLPSTFGLYSNYYCVKVTNNKYDIYKSKPMLVNDAPLKLELYKKNKLM
eukprot:409253_1